MGIRKKILILEDEQEVAQLYAKRLKANGYEPTLAFDGLQGLEKLKQVEPDLILLDMNMPKMSGVQFYQRICGSDGKPKYPVLVVTGRADLEALFKDFQVDGFIIKPFEGARLLNEIEIVLNKQYRKKGDGTLRKIVIVDDDAAALEKIVSVFSKAGYETGVAESGVAGIEKVMADPPDLAMVSLSLVDMSGDLVILRLQQIAKTKRVASILYVRKDYECDKTVMAKFASKSGVNLMFEYNNPSELLDAAVSVFRKSEEEKY